MAGVLYEEIFDIKDIDPEGKQFERVKRIHAECESSKMELILDVNSLLFSPNVGEKVNLKNKDNKAVFLNEYELSRLSHYRIRQTIFQSTPLDQ